MKLLSGLMVFAASVLVACSGNVVNPDGRSDSPGGQQPGVDDPRSPTNPSGSSQPQAARVRRLTGTEIQNSVRDIFGFTPNGAFPEERIPHKFTNQFDLLGVPLAFAEAVGSVAEQAAAKAVPVLAAAYPCSGAEATCAKGFVSAIGLKVFRRPVTADEQMNLLGLYAETRAQGGPHSEAIAAVIEAMLQSPHFLFRTELGAESSAGSKSARLTSYEVASALSYFLWQSTPDDELLQAAADNGLSNASNVGEQVARLLGDSRAKSSLRAFFLEWTEVAKLDESKLAAGAYPEFNAKLLASMRAELAAFFDARFWSGSGGLAPLLTSPKSFVDADLAKLYGLPRPAGSALAEVDLDGAKRAGFFTQAAFLSSHARSGGGFSPVFLGHFVRTKMLCEILPSPPNDVPSLPPANAAVSTRARFGQHSENANCRVCHDPMDPIGWGLEQYDALGRFHETEGAGIKLSGEGEVLGTDVGGKFKGAVALAGKLAASDQVQDCFAGQLLEYALGRSAALPEARTAADNAAIKAAVSQMKGEGDLSKSLSALATSEAMFVRDASAVPMGGSK